MIASMQLHRSLSGSDTRRWRYFGSVDDEIRVTSASSEYNDTAPLTQFKITHLFHLVSYSHNILKWSEFMIRVSQMNKVNLVIQLIFVYVKSNCRLLTEGPLLIIYFVTGSKSPTSHLCFGNSGFNSMTGFGGSSTVTDWKAVKRASVRFQIQLHSPEMDLREKLTWKNNIEKGEICSKSHSSQSVHPTSKPRLFQVLQVHSGL